MTLRHALFDMPHLANNLMYHFLYLEEEGAEKDRYE